MLLLHLLIAQVQAICPLQAKKERENTQYGMFTGASSFHNVDGTAEIGGFGGEESYRRTENVYGQSGKVISTEAVDFGSSGTLDAYERAGGSRINKSVDTRVTNDINGFYGDAALEAQFYYPAYGGYLSNAGHFQEKYILRDTVDIPVLDKLKWEDTHLYGTSVLPGKFGTDEAAWGSAASGAFSRRRQYRTLSGIRHDGIFSDEYFRNWKLANERRAMLEREARVNEYRRAMLENNARLFNARNASWESRMFALGNPYFYYYRQFRY